MHLRRHIEDGPPAPAKLSDPPMKLSTATRPRIGARVDEEYDSLPTTQGNP